MTTQITQSNYEYRGRVYTVWTYDNELAIMDDEGYDVSLMYSVVDNGMQFNSFTVTSADPEEYIHQCFLNHKSCL